MSADAPSNRKSPEIQSGATAARFGRGEPTHGWTDGFVSEAETPTSRWRFALLVLLCWTVPGLMTTTFGLTLNDRPNSSEPEYSLVPIFVSQLGVWWYWAAATPVVWWLGRRFPIERQRLPWSIPVHAGLSVIAGLLYAASSALIIQLSFPATAGAEPLAQWFRNYLTTRMPVGVLLYFALLGIGAALDSQQRLRQRDRQASQLFAQLARAQVQALQTQLQPHFLFNTLHAIGMLVHEDPSAAGRMLTRLGDLLRQTLALTDVPEITLRDELSILDDYLGIERVRFGDRLSVDLDIDPSLLSAAVPTFVMQPLVENAVRFGVTSRVGPGRIRIIAKRVGSSVQLVVQDDGAEAFSGQSGSTHSPERCVTAAGNAAPPKPELAGASTAQTGTHNAGTHGAVMHNAATHNAATHNAGTQPVVAHDAVQPNAAQPNSREARNGVGLSSIKARLAALYPNAGQASLALIKLPNGGTSAVLSLPWRELHA